jgi:hypothetical protein
MALQQGSNIIKKGTKHNAIYYGSTSFPNSLITYANANYGNDLDNCKSWIRIVLILNGEPIS